MNKLFGFVDFVCEVVSSLFMFFVTLLLIAQVILRFGFSTGLPWAEEVAKYLTIWAVMLGAPVMIKKGNLIRVDFLDNLWNPKLAILRDLAFHVFICFILSILTYQGWQYAGHGKNSMALSIPISLFWAYVAVPIGAGLMLFYYFLNICKNIVEFLKGGKQKCF